MPHTSDVFLPIACEKQSLYELFISELSTLYGPGDLPTSNTFMQVWAKHFPHLKVPHSVTLGKCDVCCTLNTKIEAAKGKEKKALKEEKKKHLKLQSEVCFLVLL